MNILFEIAEKTKERVNNAMSTISMDTMIDLAEKTPDINLDFSKAIKKDSISFICEIKKASPSKGIIDHVFDYTKIAREYLEAKVDAISVLTEPFYFKGHNEYLQDIHKSTHLPLLRKDFIVHPYMIYEAKCIGASAILLIVAILTPQQLKYYIQIATSLGLSVLVETHTKEEIAIALDSGAKIVGVNNRDLKTFVVDINITEKLRAFVPKEITFVSESGIETSQDINFLKSLHVDAVLIGETMMRSFDKKQTMYDLRGSI